MDKVSTRPQAGATTSIPARPARIATVDSAAAPIIEFDSSAIDAIIQRTAFIKGLASCAACLSAVEAVSGQFAGYELTDDALPSLSIVIGEMAADIDDAADRLWMQYRQAMAFAQGREVQS